MAPQFSTLTGRFIWSH